MKRFGINRHFVFTVLGVLALVGLLGGIKTVQIRDLISASEAMVPPPASVTVTPVADQQWEVVLKAVGSLEAVEGVTVSADLPGRITEILFQPGSQVQAGDKLIQQDISSELAQLRAAEANVNLARANLQRVEELFGKKVSSRSEMDTAEARFKEAVAQADIIRTTIEKKTICAPFDGHLGIRLVNRGQDLAGGTPIVSLQAVESMFVNFSLPQQHLQFLKPGLGIRLTADAVPGKVFEGKLTAIDPKIDSSTRSVKIQATLANPDMDLLPGMFANVDVVLPERESVLAVPGTAISHATFGNSVFVVEESVDSATGNKQFVAQQQFVQIGRAQGDFVAVTKGLQPDQKVVTAGVFKLRNGAPVAISSDTQLDFQLNPRPEDN